jgi:Leucine-rich repeat (LRR) protein
LKIPQHNREVPIKMITRGYVWANGRIGKSFEADGQPPINDIINTLTFEEGATRVIDPIPDTVTHIYLSSTVEELPAVLPESLQSIGQIIMNGRGLNLRSLPDSLPDSLTMLDIAESKVKKLPDTLPTNLNLLWCSFCKQLKSLPPILPSNLKQLRMNDSSITELPELPDSLGYLYVDHTSLTSLPKLPSSLYSLDIRATKIEKLPALPANLRILDCKDTKTLIELPTLPPNLKYLDISSTSITELPALPDSLKSLILNDTHVCKLPPLPNGLQELSIQSSKITTLPYPLPESLVILTCSDTNISYLPQFPKSLKTLYATFVPLEDFPETPPGQLSYVLLHSYDIPVKAHNEEVDTHLQRVRDALELKKKKRMVQRCKQIKEELMAVTWHTDRVLDWCDPKAFEYED